MKHRIFEENFRAWMLSIIKQYITSSKDDRSITDHATEVLDTYIKNTVQHVDLVKECGGILMEKVTELQEDAEQFKINLEFHDHDKLNDPKIIPIYAIGCYVLYFNNGEIPFEYSKGIETTFEEQVWPRHYKNNQHHVAEHFGSKEGDVWVVGKQAPVLAIAEMVADWMAMGITHGDSANAWWNKTKDKKWKFDPANTELVEMFLKVEEESQNQLNWIKRFKLPAINMFANISPLKGSSLEDTNNDTSSEQNPIENKGINEDNKDSNESAIELKITPEDVANDIEDDLSELEEYLEEVNKLVADLTPWEINHQLGRYDTSGSLAIGKISEKNINMDIVNELMKYPKYLEVLKHWLTVPDYTLLPELVKFGTIIDRIYKFNKPIVAYRGLRTGVVKTRQSQHDMGIITTVPGSVDTDGDSTVIKSTKPEIKPGYTFDYITKEPLSVTRSAWITKTYGNVILKTTIDPSIKKLVVTNELSFILQRLEARYFQYRPINLSSRTEVILFPNQTFKFEVVTTTGDISSEVPELAEGSLESINSVNLKWSCNLSPSTIVPTKGKIVTFNTANDAMLEFFKQRIDKVCEQHPSISYDKDTLYYDQATNQVYAYVKTMYKDEAEFISKSHTLGNGYLHQLDEKSNITKSITLGEVKVVFSNESVSPTAKIMTNVPTRLYIATKSKMIGRIVAIDKKHAICSACRRSKDRNILANYDRSSVSPSGINISGFDSNKTSGVIRYTVKELTVYEIDTTRLSGQFTYEGIEHKHILRYEGNINDLKNNVKQIDHMTDVSVTIRYESYDDQSVEWLNNEYEIDSNSSTEALSTKEYTESDINSVEDLKEFYKHCSYGLIDFKANKPWKETHKNTTFEDWEKEWRLLSVEQLLKFKCGICYDTAKANDYFLTKWKIDHVNLFAYTKRSAGDDYDDDPTHTFTVYKDTDGKWKWLEGSWGPFKNNDWSESSSDALIKNIGKALANNAGVTNLIGVITSWPKDGVSMNEFYHALKDQAIKKYKYEIKPDALYSKEDLSDKESDISISKYNGSKEELEIIRQCVNLSARSINPKDEGYDKATFEKLVNDNAKGPYWIIRNGDDIIGSVSIRSSTVGADKVYKCSAINDFAILEKYQGKGLGKKALLAIIAYIRKTMKNKDIGLGVGENNTKAISLYKSVGFKRICGASWGEGDQKFIGHQMLLKYEESSSEALSPNISKKKFVLVSIKEIKSGKINVGSKQIYDSINSISDKKYESLIVGFNSNSANIVNVNECEVYSLFSKKNKWYTSERRDINNFENPTTFGDKYVTANISVIISTIDIPAGTILDVVDIDENWGEPIGKQYTNDILIRKKTTSGNIKYEKLFEYTKRNKDITRYAIVAKSSLKKGDVLTVNKAENANTSFDATMMSSIETVVPNISKKKAAIIKYICDVCDILDPSKTNSKRYHRILDHMTDKEFDQWMNYVKEGKWQIHIVAPNMIVNLRNENILKAADKVGCKLFHRLWIEDPTTGRKYLTDNEYLILNLPVRRQQQFLDEKMSVPENDRKIDGLTGQVTGDSRACSVTNPEIQILAARGLDATLEEFVNVRGGNMHAYAEFRRQAEETGEITLNTLDPNTHSRVAVVGQVLVNSMMLDTNIVE